MGLGFSSGGMELGRVVFVFKTDLCQCVLAETRCAKQRRLKQLSATSLGLL